MDWVSNLNKAIRYIEDHLLSDLDCDRIAAEVYLSGCHFQRAFSLLVGMTVGEYIRNRRLSLAGQELTLGKSKVIDVALKYGYESPESFAKAFSRFHGITPHQAKQEGAVLKAFNPLCVKIILEGGMVMDYRILNREAFQLAAKVRTFHTADSMQKIPQFWAEYMSDGSHQKVCGAIGFCEAENPEAHEFRYGIGFEYSEGLTLPEGFELVTVPAGTWAVFKCVGPMPESIQETWKRVYSEWLPQAEYELVPGIDMEVYTEGDIHSPDYVSEVWIPVKKK